MLCVFKWIRSDLTIKNGELNCTSCNSLACLDTHRSLAEEQKNTTNSGRHSQFADRDVSCRCKITNPETATFLRIYLLPDSSQKNTERIITKVLKKSTVFYGKGKFIILCSKDSYLLLSWATWSYLLSLKSVFILSWHLHVGQLRTLYSSIFRSTLIHSLLHTCCMPCPIYPPCPSHPKINRRRLQINNNLNMQFHLS